MPKGMDSPNLLEPKANIPVGNPNITMSKVMGAPGANEPMPSIRESDKMKIIIAAAYIRKKVSKEVLRLTRCGDSFM